MIHSESNQGFTLVEVMISVLIIGTALTAIMSTQSVMLLSIKKITEQFSRIVLAKNFLYQTRLAEKKSANSKIQTPETSFKYTQQKASGSIGQHFKDLYREQLSWEWTDGSKKYTDTIVSLIFKPKKQEEAQ